MRLQLKISGWLLAVGIAAGMALPCAAENRDANRPPQPQKQERQVQKQQRPQRPQEARRPQNQPHDASRPRNDRPSHITPASPSAGPGNSLNRGNRPPNAGSENVQRPNFNPNRPPNASSSHRNTARLQDLSPEQQRKVLENNRRLQKLSPAEHQELHRREDVFSRLTAEQKSHIKNDLFPKWQQMPAERQRAIRQRLGVLQNMPESARNQHLNDPNFTRGMSEEDKAMLRDLSHMHVGAPDPPTE